MNEMKLPLPCLEIVRLTDAINNYMIFIKRKASLTTICNSPKLIKPRKIIAKPFMRTKLMSVNT